MQAAANEIIWQASSIKAGIRFQALLVGRDVNTPFHVAGVLQARYYWIRHSGLYKVNIVFAACCAAPLGVLTYVIFKRVALCKSLERSGERIW